MQTLIAPELAGDPRVVEAEKQLRRCVHCGFCLATCPTYDLVGDELDSPRGRIYLIKQVVEGHAPTRTTQRHLDRCLTCRACETTCPSGVEYGHLVDQGRSLVEERVRRPLGERLLRRAILAVLPYPARVAPLVRLGQLARPLLPGALAAHVPPRQSPGARPAPATARGRTMLVLEGCAQAAMTPATNAACARVLDALGVTLKGAPRAGCCGAVSFHLNEQDDARDFMRRNIDAWWPDIEAGAEAIVTTASGCGVMVKDYGHVLADDPAYAEKAARVAELAVDVVEVLAREDLSGFEAAARAMGRVAYHPPCTLQHGQKLPEATERLLARLGFELVPVADKHLCCGSAGTYSILQPRMSGRLLANKVAALTAHEPDIIATSNVGCQLHIAGGSGRTVVHWVELVDRLIAEAGTSARHAHADGSIAGGGAGGDGPPGLAEEDAPIADPDVAAPSRPLSGAGGATTTP